MYLMSDDAIKEIENGNYRVLNYVKEDLDYIWGNSLPCEVCNELTPHYTFAKKKVLIPDLYSKEYIQPVYESICSKCGSKFSPVLFIDYELKVLNDIERRKNNLIPNSIIRQIPLKYNISENDLNLILGIDFNKFYDIYLPSKSESDLLYEVYENPSLFLEYLEKNSDLISNESYIRSFNSTMYLIKSEIVLNKKK